MITYIIFILLSAEIDLFAQGKFKNKISGRVTNAETGEPLIMVNVFFANTTRGDATDKDGYYLIENISPGTYDLVFLMMGYELEIIQVQFKEQNSIKYSIKLRPRVLIGKEIQVVAAVPKEWRKNLQKFMDEFIGTTENAKKCNIINPEVLNFKIDSKNDKFIASTDSILRVENRSLGYRLHIILDTFRISRDSLIIATYPRYEELVPESEQELNTWNANRRRTYQGSFRHFLSALARGTVEQEDFWLFTLNGKYIKSDQLNIMPDTSLALKWLYLDQPLKVIYKGLSRSGVGKYIRKWGANFPLSYIYPKKRSAQIDTLGNLFTKFAIIHKGYWYKERIADMFPLDYILEKELQK